MEKDLSSDDSDFLSFDPTQNISETYNNIMEDFRKNLFGDDPDAMEPYKIVESSFNYGELLPPDFGAKQMELLRCSLKKTGAAKKCILCNREVKHLQSHIEHLHTIFFRKCPFPDCSANFVDNPKIACVLFHIKAAHDNKFEL